MEASVDSGSRPGVWIMLSILLPLSLTSCATPGGWLRERSWIRGAFYPPVISAETRLGADTPGERSDHTAYAELLSDVVDDEGWVNYNRLEEREPDLDAYIALLAAVDLSRLSRYSHLAFLLNAYNAFTLRLVLDHPGLGSILDIRSDQRWKDERWSLSGRLISLDRLEHDWIRRGFGEPRVHFALVCAARGCPRLRNEPYTGTQLQDQLADQARHFLSRHRNLEWITERNLLRVSEIFDWFRSDFGQTELDVVEAILPYLDPRMARAIRDAKERLSVRYIPYDWSLNGSWREWRS